MLTKLSKEGLVKASSGAKGGDRLPSNWEAISFLDIVHAIEGKQSLFDCYVHEDPNCTIKNYASSRRKNGERIIVSNFRCFAKKIAKHFSYIIIKDINYL
ncbi:Rrf2 family transcriptional regulator [Vagococcus carniphilus]|uniref:Rrf2 family transcriptional regulator n=1 Tax=Vagococcus carniphilus TaxID=218144 RepID=UPI002892C67F|nr:Rrf2 family transcriptional regulator [Vagococcus carniphilus]